MDKFIEMDYDDFVQTYKPITNHLGILLLVL